MRNLTLILSKPCNLEDIANYWEHTATKTAFKANFVKEVKNFEHVYENFLNEWNLVKDRSNVKKELSKLPKTSDIKNDVEEQGLKLSSFIGLNQRIAEILGLNQADNKKSLKDPRKKDSTILNDKVFINLNKRNTYIPLVTQLMTELRQSFLENRVRRYAYKHKLQLDWYTKKPRKWRSPVTFYKRRQVYIRRRFRKFSRFRVVHWYLPSYIYFDSRSLRAVFLHNPKPEEIKFSFKCSVHRVHAFYKGLGL